MIEQVDSRGRPLLGTRRTLQSGTIEERRPGYFVVRLRAGTDDSGRRVTLRRSGRATRAEAETWLIEMGARAHVEREANRRARERRRALAGPGPRFDLAAIDEHLRRRAAVRGVSVARALSEAGGVDRATAYRWLEVGSLDADQADTVAVALGHHPSALWPSWWDESESAA